MSPSPLWRAGLRRPRKDYFGGILARQDIVIALHKGAEEGFVTAEKVCREMFAPVVKAHRITVEQMAILEPATAEVVEPPPQS